MGDALYVLEFGETAAGRSVIATAESERAITTQRKPASTRGTVY